MAMLGRYPKMKTILFSIISLTFCSCFLHAAEKQKGITTIEIVSENVKIEVKNDANAMAAYLKKAILLHGIDKIEVKFINQFWVNGKEIAFEAEFNGEKKSNFYRFLEKKTGDAIAVDYDLDKAIKNFIDQNGDNLSVTINPPKKDPAEAKK